MARDAAIKKIEQGRVPGQPVGAKTHPSPTARFARRNVSLRRVFRPSGKIPGGRPINPGRMLPE